MSIWKRLSIVTVFAAITLCSRATDVTLSWDAPTNYTDGTALTNSLGYKIGKGSVSWRYTATQDVGNVTSYRWANVVPDPSWLARVELVADNTSWTVTWPKVASLGTAGNTYFAVLAYVTNTIPPGYGTSSDWSDELSWSPLNIAVTNYVVQWGTNALILDKVVNLGTNPVWRCVRKDYPRTDIYASAVACMTGGGVLTNGIPVAIYNRQLSAPTNLVLRVN